MVKVVFVLEAEQVSRFPPPGNIRLTDPEMAGILSALPSGAESKFLEDKRFVPGIFLLPDDRVRDPHESFQEYERVLDQIKRVDPARFAKMHKGTPYYVMGWLAYTLGDFERGVFYMDAALSEDIVNNPKWQDTPAAAFLFLNPLHLEAAAGRVVTEIRAEVDRQIERYSAAGRTYTTDDLVNKFIKPRADDSVHRSIVTALLTFMLEGEERVRQARLKSAHGGTLEPFLSHLFKGCLVFESVLKANYHSGGMKAIGDYLATSAARADLGLGTKPLYTELPRPFTFNDVLAALPAWRGHPFAERSVAIAYGTRNTSGHDLAWPATLDQVVYEELYEGILNAIFLLIQQKY